MQNNNQLIITALIKNKLIMANTAFSMLKRIITIRKSKKKES